MLAGPSHVAHSSAHCSQTKGTGFTVKALAYQAHSPVAVTSAFESFHVMQSVF